ncbi:DUF4347 domain-containing protein [Flavilitoribacter nigricans]|uniref:DUF4347 domain-containing protein n=1 Tax=Flavilitoribacter nigricans (strain ATCC 23147 / DSM 23189 / NBRC 102662 / NCIMB 1420 / SS-2) TaxID=1122177 RepID=A0A2D0NEE0_FLAN2|nr:DUF4347 domain-containing protein [Flavilitoribacter nigricans]PHN06874.1 hypothetical protein CRP01_09295 [Flavilitoribacter nigricans DSM 23189 = NBRC 102662]
MKRYRRPIEAMPVVCLAGSNLHARFSWPLAFTLTILWAGLCGLFPLSGFSNTPFSSQYLSSETNIYVDQAVEALPLAEAEAENGRTLHLFSHGRPGYLLLENEWRNAHQIAEWLQSGKLLTGKTQLNLYGCNFAEGESGRAAVAYLQRALGLSVAASDDVTGAQGDWELEVGAAREVMAFPAYAYNLQINEKLPFVNDGTNFNNITATVTNTVASVIPLCAGSISNTGNLVDNNTSNFASVSITGLGCDGTVSVKDNDASDTYPGGAFAGFRVSSAGILQASVGAEITISTYNNNVLQESEVVVTTGVGVNSLLISGDGTIVLGFITTSDFDEIRITYDALIGVLFTAQIYHAVIEVFAAGVPLSCNEQTLMNNPDYPTIIDNAQTEITGVCVGCTIDDPENVISESDADFATISLPLGVAGSGSIAVWDVLTDYAAGTFAGFNISNANLVGANLLSGITITTYLDGVERESTANIGTDLASVNSSLLNGAGNQLIGFITTLSFDEVKIEVSNLLGVLNETQVYNAVFQTFCAGPSPDCALDTYLVTPDYPVVVDNEVSSLICVGCSIDDAQNIIDSDTDNFASIDLVAGVGLEATVSVRDVITDYAAGTFAGFDIENTNLLDVNLLAGAQVVTYLDGVEREDSDDGVLLSLQLLGGDRQVVGFTSTLSFDEIRLTVRNTVGLDLGTTLVYGAVIRGPSDAGTAPPEITGDAGSGVSVSNVCPATTFDLTTLVASIPAGATVEWYTTNNSPPTGGAYATPTMATAGTYYAYFYDAVEGCYSLPSNPVTMVFDICAPVIDCNEKSAFVNDEISFDNLSASVTDDVLLPCIGGVTGLDNLVDADTDNFATVSITGLACDATISVVDNDAGDTYPGGYFAGFEVSSAGLLQASIGATVTIETYNNGAFAESFDAITSLVGANTSLLDPDGNIVLGFVTTLDFDEIRITYESLVGVLFTAQVYHAVIEEFCAGPALACNTQTLMNNPDYPTIVDNNETGITGVACVGCTVDDAENVISASTVDFATITLDVNVGTVGSIAVQDVLTDYPAGTFAGFNISNPDLVEANVLSGITVRTYLDGALQESSTNVTLVSASSSLINGTGDQLVGFVTTLPFDEVKLEVTNLLGAINITQVYNAVFQAFCAGPTPDCATNTYLTNPDYPVIVDNELTGITGAVCALCSVNDSQNVIDADTDNEASIVLTAGVLSTGSIAVKDVLTDYPGGYFAGFDIDNPTLLGVDLLAAGEVSTYLDGVLQETSGATLLSLEILTGSRQIVGFFTTLPFDEVRFSISNLVDVDAGTTLVYGAVLRSVSAAPLLIGDGDDGDSEDGLTVSNICPATTFDLTTLITPVPGTTIEWYTSNDNPPAGAAYATPTMATAGTYYAYFLEDGTGCYSLASNPVTVIFDICDPMIDCNVKSAFVNDEIAFDNLSASVTDDVLLPCIGGVIGLDNLVDADTDNFATVSITGLACDATISVVDNDAGDTYPAGYFAGFEVSSVGLLQASIDATVTIETYNNGVLAESYDAVTALIGANTALLDPDGNIVLGFVTTMDFDEIRITYESLVGVLFTAQVYHAVVEAFCAGPALECNTQTLMNNPDYPTIIDVAETGISGVACIGCTVDDAENVISASTADFATITLDVNVGTVGSIAVQDVLTDYPAGTFAGFNISNPDLVEANVLSGITVRTYLDGALQESSTNVTLVSASSSLLNGAGDQLVGFVTTLPFDEVKLEVTNLLGAVNITEVYNAVFQAFCVGPDPDCATNTYLTNPDYPVIIDNELTGITGAVCALCSVNDSQNVIDDDTDNRASIVLTAGVLSTGSIAVKDVLTDYPAGTFAGFDIENPTLLGVDLFAAGEVTTYLDGALQESSSGVLLTLEILTGSRQIVGFTTTLPFDEVRFSVSNLVDVDAGTTFVYGAVLRGVSNAGVDAPVLDGDTGTGVMVSNTCPTPTFDLNSLVMEIPAGASLVWFTTNDNPPMGAPYATPDMATAGVYYAYFYDAVAGCYSLASNAVTVTLEDCGLDTDGDGNPDFSDPDPNDPCVGYIEGSEVAGNPIWANADCDGDGVINVTERDVDMTSPYDPCSLNQASVTLVATSTGDCDGDGVTDADEINGTDGDPNTPGDNTDPNDPCSLNLADVTLVATSTGDCDGDGVTDADEINGTDGDPNTPGDNTDPNDPCSLNLADVTLVATSTGDCDGDGVTDADEINGTDGDPNTPGDNTDPLDPCDYNPGDVTLPPSMAWEMLDCDNDGNPNGDDPNPLVATALDDNAVADFGVTTTVDILANDDFLPGANTSLTQVGGDAGGTITFDPLAGTVDYTPLVGEVGTTVTIDYQVCNTTPDPDVCATATVFVMVQGQCTITTAVWLEGAYDGVSEMRTDLNTMRLLPGQDPAMFMGVETPVGQPYSGAPWAYNGTEGDAFDYMTVGNADAGYHPDVVDWVLVSLRSDVDASTTLCTQAGLLYKDGTILFPEGCNCALLDGQEVYIVIEHRNHLPVMSDVPVLVSGGGQVSYDFRTQQSFTTFLGDGQKLLGAGVYGMFAANGDQTSAAGARTDVNATDEAVWTDNNGTGDAYNRADYNLDGDVNANDESLWLNNTAKASDVNFE